MLKLESWEERFTNCIYSDRLLEKLILLNINAIYKIDIYQIKKAIYYAKTYHAEQKRKSGEPYYSHPLEVAYKVSDYIFKTDILVTSILHDVIEDTNLTKEDLNCIFDDNIANKVERLTRIKSGNKISSFEIIKSLCQDNQYELLLIKYFDRLHNIQTINAKPIDKILKTIEETLTNFISVGIYFESSFKGFDKENETILKLCYQGLNIKTPAPASLIISNSDDFQLPSLNY